ncbi:DUF2182 domain-containing protein [Celeribacter sp. PS-C1]|uniref:DUF2182 domain-containing protein n=1 Tax=Celeribacter sp. PS-C1 TaxID=2820813 RepID=UPI002103EBC0|nr:DUF2182 domain-containing protein [Celeribacter sp. PS-C1]
MTLLEITLRRDQMIVIIALSMIVVLAALYTVFGIGMPMSSLKMTGMSISMPDMMMRPADWSVGYAALVFFMWWIMMIAMMVPSAAPTILLYASLVRKNKNEAAPYASVAFFLSGYLAVWGAFSLIATLSQWGLSRLGVLSGMMELVNVAVASSVLIAAGTYQFTPLKKACLHHCQNPLVFLMHHWKPGAVGAYRMGAENGQYCLGCCWFLMALLFVGGVMNLFWIAGIALYVGIEKLSSEWKWLPPLTGGVLIAAGVSVLL